MAPANSASSYTYNVSSNGSAADWYWQVTRNQEIIMRGIAATPVSARADAMRAVLCHADPWRQKPLPDSEEPSPPVGFGAA